MARVNYTREQRSEALKLYAEVGPAEASRRTGIKRATISKWACREGASSARASRTAKATEAALQSYAERRARLSAKAAQEAERLLDRLGGERHNPVNAANIARAVNLLLRDAALLADGATQQVEHRTQEEFDREVEELVNKLHEDALEYVRRELGLKEIPEHIREAVLAGRAKEVRQPPPRPEIPTAPEPVEPVEKPPAPVRSAARRPISPPSPQPVPAPTGGPTFEAADFIPNHDPTRPLFSDPDSERIAMPLPRP